MGSIAEVWSWLIHVPYLGWLVLGIAAVSLVSIVLYAILEFRGGMRDRRPWVR